MFERDYMIRLIAQAAKALGAAANLREQKKSEQALAQIDDFLSRELRLKTRMIMGLSDDDLLAMLRVGGAPNAEFVAIIAAFLQEEAELLAEMDRMGESFPRSAKALRLNLYLMREIGGLDGWDVEPRIAQLLEAIAPYEWDAATTKAVWLWREACGQYAEAENLLYELWEMSGIHGQEGLRFYERLNALDDERLTAGGLPREELEEGRKQWAAMSEEAVR